MNVVKEKNQCIRRKISVALGGYKVHIVTRQAESHFLSVEEKKDDQKIVYVPGHNFRCFSSNPVKNFLWETSQVFKANQPCHIIVFITLLEIVF